MIVQVLSLNIPPVTRVGSDKTKWKWICWRFPIWKIKRNVTFDESWSSVYCGIRCCICKSVLTGDVLKLSNDVRMDRMIDYHLDVEHGNRFCRRDALGDRIFVDVVIDGHERLKFLSWKRSSATQVIADLLCNFGRTKRVRSFDFKLL